MVSFPVEELKGIKTPCYYYDMDLLQRTLSTVKYEAEKVGAYVHYAVKANANPRILKTVAEFGFGAEIGISTQKLHARGPMGLLALTSTKYIILGNGQIRK